jgi:threonine-phosphate decarboxylase
MLKPKEHFHGSDLEKIEKIYGIRKEDITSFSANVNPLGISPKLRETLASHVDAICTYPDREYTSLRSCIGDYVGCDMQNILVGNGSTELISLIIQIERPKKALILGPTYSEYEREVKLLGGTTIYYPLKEADGFRLQTEDFIAKLNESIDMLVICNPNNPTSTCVSSRQMRSILDACKEHGIFVMIDETYVEFAEDVERVTAVPLTKYYDNLIILRGTSKFFAAPGLRLGYAITGNRDLLKNLGTRQNPWSISSLAAIAGEIMFTDQEYIEKTRALISSERKRMYDMLSAHPDYKVYEPSANFLLVKLLREDQTSDSLFDKAIRRCMMIRDCSTFPFLDDRYIRFCIMSPEMNDKLMACILE